MVGPMSARRRGGPRSSVATLPWIDRWLAACRDLVELERSNPMTDAVIDEIDGRWIRIGDKWLADFASCNYLGFDLDREIIDAVPEYIDRWGTHPSWSSSSTSTTRTASASSAGAETESSATTGCGATRSCGTPARATRTCCSW